MPAPRPGRARVLTWIAAAAASAITCARPALAQRAPDAGVADGGAATAEADDRRARAEAEFSRAMEAWRRGDCLAAAAGFERALALVPHRDTRYNLARAYECDRGDPASVLRAIESYRAFLREATDAADRTEVDRRLAELEARPAEMFVTSEPLNATVRLDNEALPRGHTPWRARLAPGAHVLTFERDGYRRELRRIDVQPGQPQDLLVTMEASAPPPPPPPPPDRVLTRRTGRLISGRIALLGGFSVPRDRPTLAMGVEGGLFLRRSFSVQAHAMWIDTDGAPASYGADVGWVFVLDEVDLGVFVSGGALFSCDTSCREATFRRDSEQFIGGFTVRADVVLHPRLAVGLFGRAAWRNFNLGDSEALLASGGLALSLFL